MEAIFNPSLLSVLVAVTIGLCALIAWVHSVDLGVIAISVTLSVATGSAIAALVNFDGSYVPWTGMNMVSLGIAIWAYRLPKEEY